MQSKHNSTYISLKGTYCAILGNTYIVAIAKLDVDAYRNAAS